LLPTPLLNLIDELGRLPGIGPKSAQRMAFHLLRVPEEEAVLLATAIREVKEQIGTCEICFNIAQRGEVCGVCADSRREIETLCVVEDPRDVVALERTQQFRGRYHVLQGALSPLEGVGPDELRIDELVKRISEGAVREVIVCTNPTLEGEATAMYLARLLGPMSITVSVLASGLPVGGDLEYADDLTLGRALEGRRALGA